MTLIVMCAWFVADRGSMMHPVWVPYTVAAISQKPVTSTMVFVSPETFRNKSFAGFAQHTLHCCAEQQYADCGQYADAKDMRRITGKMK